MNIAVVGSKDWIDYNTVIRTLTVEVQDWKQDFPEDTTLTFWHSGAEGAERMVAEWVGKVEDLAKQNNNIIKDKVFFNYKNPSKFDELLNSGTIHKALVFSRGDDRRATTFAQVAKDSGIPVKVIQW
jgi:hypothetical protein